MFVKISQISHENAVLESLFNKVASLRPEIFKNTYFEEIMRTTASTVCEIYLKLIIKSTKRRQIWLKFC